MHGQSTDQNNFGKNILGIPVNHASMRGVPQRFKMDPAEKQRVYQPLQFGSNEKGIIPEYLSAI